MLDRAQKRGSDSLSHDLATALKHTHVTSGPPSHRTTVFNLLLLIFILALQILLQFWFVCIVPQASA
jgi:hypothetical protein